LGIGAAGVSQWDTTGPTVLLSRGRAWQLDRLATKHGRGAVRGEDRRGKNADNDRLIHGCCCLLAESWNEWIEGAKNEWIDKAKNEWIDKAKNDLSRR